MLGFHPIASAPIAGLQQETNDELTLAVSQALTYQFGLTRSRPNSLSISLAQEVYALLQKQRPIGLTIEQTQQLTIDLLKGKFIAFNVEQVEALAPVLWRNRDNPTAIAQVLDFIITANRAVPNSATVGQTEVISSAFVRDRPLLVTSNQVLTINASVQRLREATLTLARTLNYSFTLGSFGIKYLTVNVVETQEFSFGALRRVRGLASTIVEVLEYATSLSREKQAALTIEQLEALELVIDRSRAVASAIQQAYGLTTSLSRQREVKWTLAQVEQIYFANSKLKLMSYIIEQEQALATLYLDRARGIDFSSASLEEVIASFNRARTFIVQDAQTQQLTIDMGRLRTQALFIEQAQGVEAAIDRVRGLLQSVSNTLDISFTLSFLQTRLGTAKLVITWQRWEATATSDCSATLTLKEYSDTVEFRSKLSAAVKATDQLAAVVIVPECAL